jgi:hypothetical protein
MHPKIIFCSSVGILIISTHGLLNNAYKSIIQEIEYVECDGAK